MAKGFSSVMSKEISFKAAAVYPSKTSINLAQKEDNSLKILKTVLLCVFCAALLAAVIKFGIIDRYNGLSAAEASYNVQHEQLLALEESLKDFNSVQEEYRTYSRKWMNSEEDTTFVAVDRTEVLDLIERELKSRGTVKAIRIQNSSLTVIMSEMTLAEVSDMLEVLRAEPIVESAVLTVAESDKNNPAENTPVSFTVSVVLQAANKEAK